MDRDHRDLCAIFHSMLRRFNIDPILWGVLVFVNLQATLSPPVAISAFYKGVARNTSP
jgi:TRAP-type mannitol/chloroaromatic compound transport system permease large subunit